MAHDWMNDSRDRFPDWQTDDATARWPEVKARLSVGQEVRGKVIARAPFGVWVDVEAGHPALLLVTEMARAADCPIRFVEFPAIGAIVTATIVALGDEAEIGLSQFPSGSTWSNWRSKNPAD
jgi:hypothetical protein